MKKIVVAFLGLLCICSICLALIFYELRTESSAEQTKMKPALESSYGSAESGGIQSAPVMEFSGLKKQNEQIELWLTLSGTGIDYPVVIGEDNRYYLTHTAQKKSSSYGAIFADYRTNIEQLDFNTVIYGHNIRGGRMFAGLIDFKKQKFFDDHKTGWLYTPEETYRLEIFACIVTKPDSEIYRYCFESLSERQEHIEMLKREAVCWREIGIGANDRILTLSTCSYEYKNARTVVLAKID